MHEMFEAVRASLRLPTRRPKRRRREFVLEGSDEATTKSVSLPADQFPATASFLEFGEPAFFRGEAKRDGILCEMARLVQLGGPRLDLVAKAHGMRKVEIDHRSTPVTFARMLGKIGYCYAAGMLGTDELEEALVLPALFDRPDEIGQWVGGRSLDSVSFDVTPRDHVLRLGIWQHDVVFVEMKLFAAAPTPGYVIVVGRWAPGITRRLDAEFAPWPAVASVMPISRGD
jgi:hypothetical protein